MLAVNRRLASSSLPIHQTCRFNANLSGKASFAISQPVFSSSSSKIHSEQYGRSRSSPLRLVIQRKRYLKRPAETVTKDELVSTLLELELADRGPDHEVRLKESLTISSGRDAMSKQTMPSRDHSRPHISYEVATLLLETVKSESEIQLVKALLHLEESQPAEVTSEARLLFLQASIVALARVGHWGLLPDLITRWYQASVRLGCVPQAIPSGIEQFLQASPHSFPAPIFHRLIELVFTSISKGLLPSHPLGLHSLSIFLQSPHSSFNTSREIAIFVGRFGSVRFYEILMRRFASSGQWLWCTIAFRSLAPKLRRREKEGIVIGPLETDRRLPAEEYAEVPVLLQPLSCSVLEKDSLELASHSISIRSCNLIYLASLRTSAPLARRYANSLARHSRAFRFLLESFGVKAIVHYLSTTVKLRDSVGNLKRTPFLAGLVLRLAARFRSRRQRTTFIAATISRLVADHAWDEVHRVLRVYLTTKNANARRNHYQASEINKILRAAVSFSPHRCSPADDQKVWAAPDRADKMLRHRLIPSPLPSVWAVRLAYAVFNAIETKKFQADFSTFALLSRLKLNKEQGRKCSKMIQRMGEFNEKGIEAMSTKDMYAVLKFYSARKNTENATYWWKAISSRILTTEQFGTFATGLDSPTETMPRVDLFYVTWFSSLRDNPLETFAILRRLTQSHSLQQLISVAPQILPSLLNCLTHSANNLSQSRLLVSMLTSSPEGLLRLVPSNQLLDWARITFERLCRMEDWESVERLFQFFLSQELVTFTAPSSSSLQGGDGEWLTQWRMTVDQIVENLINRERSACIPGPLFDRIASLTFASLHRLNFKPTSRTCLSLLSHPLLTTHQAEVLLSMMKQMGDYDELMSPKLAECILKAYAVIGDWIGAGRWLRVIGELRVAEGRPRPIGPLEDVIGES